MPDYTAYPTATDISLLLKSNKMWPADSDTAGQALALNEAEVAANAARDEFERRTGWLPFLADAVATTRSFNATDYDGTLDLQGAAVAVDSIAVNGTDLVLDSGYWIDRNRSTDPITFLSLASPYVVRSPVYGPLRPGRITVTARWGRVETLPGDVWAAIQKYAGVQTLMSIENLQSVANIGMDGFSKGYDIVGIITQKDLLSTWGKDWDKVVTWYTRNTA